MASVMLLVSLFIGTGNANYSELKPAGYYLNYPFSPPSAITVSQNEQPFLLWSLRVLSGSSAGLLLGHQGNWDLKWAIENIL